MNASAAIKKYCLKKAFNYMCNDTEKNLIKIIDWADKFSNGEFESQRKAIRETIENPNHPYHSFILRVVKDIDLEVMKTAGWICLLMPD